VKQSRLIAGADGERGLASVVLGTCPAAVACTRLLDALVMSAGVVIVLTAMGLLLPIATRAARSREGQPDASRGEGRADAGPWGALLLSSVLTAIVELALSAMLPAVSARLGIYVPLIAVSMLTMGRLKDLAGISSPREALVGAARIGSAFAGILVVVTLVREVLGSGTVTLGATTVVVGLVDHPARAIGLGAGALMCLGYAAAAVRLARGGRGKQGDAPGGGGR
jgi:electron transport complex protein RnfE